MVMKMDDLISRKAAIDALEKIKDPEAKGTVGSFLNLIVQRNIEVINTLPSAQPESDWEELLVVCDNCGHVIHVKRL